MRRLFGYVLTGVAVIVLITMINTASAQPPVIPIQYSASDNRESCLQSCRAWIQDYQYKRDRGFRSYDHLYAKCVQDCEDRFWKEFDRRMGDVGGQ